jgi:hypothetical protein
VTIFSSLSCTVIDSSVIEASSIFSERASISGSTRVSSIGLATGGAGLAAAFVSFLATILGGVFFVSVVAFLEVYFCFSLDSFSFTSIISDVSSNSEESELASSNNASSDVEISSSSLVDSSYFTSASAFFPFYNSFSYSSSISAN